MLRLHHLVGLIVAISSLFISTLLIAAEEGEQQPSATDELRSRLQAALPEFSADSIKPTPIDGLYEVLFGTQVVYVSADGRYLFQGKLLDLKDRSDLTEPTVAGARAAVMAQLDRSTLISYGAEDSPHQITVFTDIDCPYCQTLHRQMADYNRLGIRISYLLFPRAGVDSESYRKAVAVWCSEDQNGAMTTAKAGGEVAAAECENPVKAHMDLGKQLGVRGTPTMVLADGRILPGYLPPERLLAELRKP